MREKKDKVKILTEKIIRQKDFMLGGLQLLLDSGAYKRRSLYKLSDHEFKENINKIKENVVMLQTAVLISEEIIASSKSLSKKYNNLYEATMKEIRGKKKNSKKYKLVRLIECECGEKEELEMNQKPESFKFVDITDDKKEAEYICIKCDRKNISKTFPKEIKV